VVHDACSRALLMLRSDSLVTASLCMECFVASSRMRPCTQHTIAAAGNC
jgi:hypothetical protein